MGINKFNPLGGGGANTTIELTGNLETNLPDNTF